MSAANSSATLGGSGRRSPRSNRSSGPSARGTRGSSGVYKLDGLPLRIREQGKVRPALEVFGALRSPAGSSTR